MAAAALPVALGAMPGAAASEQAAALAPPPPADPSGLTAARADGGLTVWVHPAEPRGGGAAEIGLWLVIPGGTIHEGDDQLGAAYLAKAAAGAALRAGPTEGLRARFRSDSGAWGRADGLAHGALTHDAIVFTLVFDAGDEQAWDAAAAHFRSLLSGWAPGDEDLASARRTAEARGRSLSPEQRAFAGFMPDLFGDQRLGQRQPIPPAETLDATTDEAVRAFVASRYRASGAVLIAVGPGDPGELLSRVRRSMGGLADRGPVTPAPAAVTRGVGGRVSVQTVEGFRPAEVSLIAVEPAGSGAGAGLEGDGSVLDRVAAELVSARVRTAAALAEPDLVSAEAGIKRWVGGVRVAEVSLRVDEDAASAGVVLENAGRAAAAELARIARHEFGAEEIRDARAAVLVAADRAAAAWREAGPGEIMDALAAAAAAGAGPGDRPAWIAPVEARAHASRVLASSTDSALAAHARAVFRPDELACVMISGRVSDGPTAEQARGVLGAALAGDGVAQAGVVPARLAEVFENGRGAGQIREISNEPITGVWSGVLANGVLVHTRRTPTPDAGGTTHEAGLVVRLTLCDGLSRETAATAGRTRDAVGAWRYARTGTADAGQLRAWASGHGLKVRAFAGNTTVCVEITAPDAGAMEAALELGSAMLAEPRVDGRFADRFPARAGQAETPTGAGLRRLGELLFEPGDARARPAPRRDAISPDDADAWLAQLAAAPLEVAIVGDVDPERAIDAAARFLGVLPTRATPSAVRERGWGAVPGVESIERVRVGAAERGADGAEDRPGAVLGLVFADAADLDRLRPMVIAARGVEKAFKDLLESAGHAGRAQAWVWTGDGAPGRATLVVRYEGDADAHAALELAERAVAMVASGQSDGAVIEREIERARRSVARAWEEPAFWAEKLGKLASHGLGIGSLSGMPAAYDAITPADVRDTLARAAREGLRKRVVVLPE